MTTFLDQRLVILVRVCMPFLYPFFYIIWKCTPKLKLFYHLEISFYTFIQMNLLRNISNTQQQQKTPESNKTTFVWANEICFRHQKVALLCDLTFRRSLYQMRLWIPSPATKHYPMTPLMADGQTNQQAHRLDMQDVQWRMWQ